MFSLRDFFHLPELDHWVERMAEESSGLVLVTGVDARPKSLPVVSDTPPGANALDMLPSGRSAIFSSLIDTFLSQRADLTCRIVAVDKDTIRVPRGYKSRLKILTVDPPYTYSGRIAEAVRDGVGLLILDRLDSETVRAALQAARTGMIVLSELNSVFYGAEILQQLEDLGATPDLLPGLRWLISMQRHVTLCGRCKARSAATPLQRERLLTHPLRYSEAVRAELVRPGGLLAGLYPGDEDEELTVFTADGCQACRGTGRQGETALFDVFYNSPEDGEGLLSEATSILPMEAYAGKLVELGYLALDDYLDFEANQYRRIGRALIGLDEALRSAASAFERKLAEVEVGNRVLEQRTRSLVSLHEIGQAMVASVDLSDLASRMCRFVQTLCGADRVIVYYLENDETAKVLASGGWDSKRVPSFVAAYTLHQACALGGRSDQERPVPFPGWPPGIPPRNPDVEGAALRAGLCVPLIAQEITQGFIVAHTTRKASFSQSETALLQTLAHQAALSIQRARLFENLQNKIDQLEAAQHELEQKKRLEHEMALARQVQQSMLPDTFPVVPGWSFAARNEPARSVGGDFYDVMPMADGRFGLAIADVSDKGLGAALYMSLTRSLLRAEARREASPRVVLENVNSLLLELGQPEMFVTLFYGVIDPDQKRLYYSRAGHDRPVVLRQGDVRPLGGYGTALGILTEPDFRLTEESIDFKPGDRLVLYTDGLYDVLSPSGEMFDRSRLFRLLQKHAQLPAAELCKALFEDLLAFQDEMEQFDDMSLVVVAVED